jgi:hypothetical protein
VVQEPLGATGLPPEDRDLRDEHARSTARPAWFAALVILDVLAIVAFVALVVIPRLT